MAKKRKKSDLFAPENRVALIFISVSLVLIISLTVAMFSFIIPKSGGESQSTITESAVVMGSDGKQVITMQAKNGFFPSMITAKSGVPSVLRVKTSNTIDCSNVLNIPSLGISKRLPISGVMDVEIPPQASGSEITGTCSMGHYSFKIKFI